MIAEHNKKSSFDSCLTALQSQNIKLEWLYYFVVLAEIRHFSEAARKLGLTQQALSKVILQLEDELNISLIQRRPWELTEYGQLFLNKVKSLLNQVNLLENFWLDRYQNLQNRPVQIAVESGLETFISDLCLGVQASLPEFNFHVHTQIENPEAALLQDEIDLLIQLSSPTQNTCLSYEPCLTSAMVLVTAPDFELSQDNNPLIKCMGDLSDLPILPAIIGLQPAIQASLTVAIELAKSSIGVLWIPECLIQTELRRKELKRIDLVSSTLAYIEYQCVYAKKASLQRPPLQALLAVIRTIEGDDSCKTLRSQIRDLAKAEYVSL